MLTKEQGQILLKIAKQAIIGKTISYDQPFLKQKRGVFVTLTIDNNLRGCIGMPYPTEQLGNAVINAAKSAAYEDPRFPPLSKQEIELTEIEISVLSLPKKCELKDIEKGDGVILESKGQSALFLPQVWETLPNKTEFLEQLSMKAFLPKDEYKIANFQKPSAPRRFLY